MRPTLQRKRSSVTHSLKIEIDQSGKIETPHLTALAYANGQHYTILISTRVKREVIGRLRARGLSRSRAAIRVFAAAVWLLLRDVIGEVSHVTIDAEYPGHEAQIKSDVLEIAKLQKRPIDPNVIEFGLIGKKSGAHQRAIEVYRGNELADRLITLGD
jgi:hypothetical protein